MNFQATDSLKSLVSGMGDNSKDKISNTHYQDQILSRYSLKAAFRNSWIIKKAITIPALDSLRKGRDWQAEQDQIKKIEEEERRLGFWNKMLECKKQARLWGGAGIVIGLKGQEDMSEPLDIEKVKKGDLSYLTVLSNKYLDVEELEKDPASEFFGVPSTYRYNGESNAFAQVHSSRVIVQIGDPHSDPWDVDGHLHNYGWGDSVLQAMYTAAMQADSSTRNVANLIFEANVDVFQVPGFMEKVATESYRKKIIDRLILATTGKSVSRALLMDKEEEYTRNSANFTNLDAIMEKFLLFASGAADIPLTRFLGQSPAGMSATGEGDMKNYHDKIQSIQNLEIKPALWRFDEVLIRSALGNRPEEIFYDWTPLEQISEKDQAEIGQKNAQSAEIFARTGVFSTEELREVVANH